MVTGSVSLNTEQRTNKTMAGSVDSIVIVSDTQINSSNRETQELQSVSQTLKDNFHTPQVHSVLQFTSTPQIHNQIYF